MQMSYFYELLHQQQLMSCFINKTNSLPTMAGLSTCSSFSNAYCATKLTEVIIAAVLILFDFIEMILGSRNYRRRIFNFIFLIEFLLLISLIFNLSHEIWGKYRGLLYFQLFFANAFFLTIFYYIGFNVLKTKISRIVLHVTYALLVLVYLGIAIDRTVEQSQTLEPYQCTQAWYVIVDSITIIVSIVLFLLYRNKQNKQRQIQQYYRSKLPTMANQLNDPFSMMWVMIITNIFCNIVSMSETIILSVGFREHCKFSTVNLLNLGKNQNINTPIHFAFLLLDYYLGGFVTLLIFRQVRRKMEKNNRNKEHLSQNYPYESSQDNNNRLELVIRTSSSANKNYTYTP